MRAKINACHVVEDVDVLTLYYWLRGEKYSASEFAHYFPTYGSARNEFERQKAEPEVMLELEVRQELLQKTPLCAKIIDVPVGDFNFQAKMFPLTHHGGAFMTKNGLLGLKNTGRIDDRSKSAEDVRAMINAQAKINSSPYHFGALNAFIEFTNNQDKTLFPDYLRMDEGLAQKAATEFGTVVDEEEKSIAQTVGGEYRPDRTIVAYILFRPKQASTHDSVMMGVHFKTKVVRGEALGVVLATVKGTVLAAYSEPNKAAAPNEAPKTPLRTRSPVVAKIIAEAKQSAPPPERKDATSMSVDELNSYLKRDAAKSPGD
jgi:hypothetical protein